MKVREFKRTTWLARPISEIFSFSAEAANLELLTPPWVNFQILFARPINIRPDIERILNFREQKLSELFGAVD